MFEPKYAITNKLLGNIKRIAQIITDLNGRSFSAVVLEKGEELFGIEVKYKKKALNKAFKNRYPEAKIRIVTADNFY